MPLTSRADIAALLIAHFPEQPVPASILVDADAGMEIQQDRRSAFLGKPWTSVSIDDWRMLGVPISVCKLYMRPDSFAYYLVSILHGSLATDGAFALALDAMLPSNQRHVPKGAWWTAFSGTFTVAQRTAISAYLQFVGAQADADDEIGNLVNAAQLLYRVSA